MNKILSQIISEKQQNLFTICKILSYGKSKSASEINFHLGKGGIYLHQKSHVLYKYLSQLLEMELIEIVEVVKKKKFYALKREYHVDAPVNVSEHDTPALISLQKTLNKYQNLPINDFVDGLIKKSKIEINESAFMIIDFETPDNYVGHEHLDFFYWKIDECETVKFNYKKFEDEVGKEVLLKPYLLKEHNKRWYLVGQWPHKQNSDNKFVTYPLDRIISVDHIYDGKNFKRDSTFNPIERWKNSVGIFTGDPSKVSFEVSDSEMNNVDFLKTSKIHSSQKEIKIDDSWLKVELNVLISFELVREIRKLGVHNLRNITPKELDQMIRKD